MTEFEDDLRREKIIADWMDKYFYSKFNPSEIATKRPHEFGDKVREKRAQYGGIDIVMKDNDSKIYLIDEKSQTNYLNNNRPSFAFEIFSFSNKKVKKGWLLDSKKKTDYYILIYPNSKKIDDYRELYDKEEIDFVNVYLIERQKLLDEIYKVGLTNENIMEEASNLTEVNTAVKIKNIPPEKFTLYKSKNYAEIPVNLVVKKIILDKIVEKKWEVTKDLVKLVKDNK